MMRKAGAMQCVFLSLALVVSISLGVSARNLDGTLGLIERPSSMAPTIVRAGDAFDVTVTTDQPVEYMRVELFQGPTSAPVFTHSRDRQPLPPTQGVLTVQATVPADMPPGLYGMSVSVTGRERGSLDASERAVKVVADWPQSYSFAHITDVHIGKQVPLIRDEVFMDIAAEINRLDVEFVLITGDIVELGTTDEYRRFVDLVDSFEAPTFVTVANHDSARHVQYWLPQNYTFDFGSHRYMCLENMVHPKSGLRERVEALLRRPDPTLGIVFSHFIPPAEYAYFGELLPAHNYRAFLYGHTHEDLISWIGPERLLLLNAGPSYIGTYNILRIENDQLTAIDPRHRGDENW